MIVKITLWDKYKLHRKIYYFEVINDKIEVLQVVENKRNAKSNKFYQTYFWDKVTHTLNKPAIVDPEAYNKLRIRLNYSIKESKDD